uniref:Uncharacterized protein n=1 Tax=Parascaris equorum TaxID=6256 RepID=A0A914R6P3_PAREQ
MLQYEKLRRDISIFFFSTGFGIASTLSFMPILSHHYLSRRIFPSDFTKANEIIRLFETDLVLKGHFTITVDADTSLQLVVWKEGTERDLPTEITKKENEAVDVWDVVFQNERIRAIGFACDQAAIVRSFSMKQTSPIPTRKQCINE